MSRPLLCDQEVPLITISLYIVNRYELYPRVDVRIDDALIPAAPIGGPPATDAEWQALDDWAIDHLLPFTGVGHTDGNSWNDLTVVACSAVWLVGFGWAW